MDDKYTRYLSRYSNDELKQECIFVSKIFDIDNITESLLIQEIDELQMALNEEVVTRFIKGELSKPMPGILCEFKLVQ